MNIPHSQIKYSQIKKDPPGNLLNCHRDGVKNLKINVALQSACGGGITTESADRIVAALKEMALKPPTVLKERENILFNLKNYKGRLEKKLAGRLECCSGQSNRVLQVIKDTIKNIKCKYENVICICIDASVHFSIVAQANSIKMREKYQKRGVNENNFHYFNNRTELEMFINKGRPNEKILHGNTKLIFLGRNLNHLGSCCIDNKGTNVINTHLISNLSAQDISNIATRISGVTDHCKVFQIELASSSIFGSITANESCRQDSKLIADKENGIIFNYSPPTPLFRKELLTELAKSMGPSKVSLRVNYSGQFLPLVVPDKQSIENILKLENEIGNDRKEEFLTKDYTDSLKKLEKANQKPTPSKDDKRIKNMLTNNEKKLGEIRKYGNELSKSCVSLDHLLGDANNPLLTTNTVLAQRGPDSFYDFGKESHTSLKSKSLLNDLIVTKTNESVKYNQEEIRKIAIQEIDGDAGSYKYVCTGKFGDLFFFMHKMHKEGSKFKKIEIE